MDDADKKVTTLDQSKKKKIPEKNNQTKELAEVNNETIEKQKVKSKKSTVGKSLENSKVRDGTSKSFMTEEISENTEESTKKTGESTEKKEESVKEKNVSSSEKVKPKKLLAATTHQKHKNTKKNSNTKSNLVNGGVKKKITKQQKAKVSVSNYSNKPSISDERLRAFGLNPKKFHNKLKYGNKSQASGTVTNSNKVTNKSNKVDKLNQKKMKRKLLSVLGN